MGWGDLSDVVSKSSLDNPLVSGMLDSWNGKIAFTVDLSAKLDLKFRRQIVSNLEWVYSPLSTATTFKPRGGKALVTVKVNPTATKLNVQVSKDGNTYLVTMPAYMPIQQYELTQGFKMGL